ncbi:anaphase-promoting complex subunit 10-like [Rousettus aegyptiacus]|uniref:anaphase-promoting complex subunit 10-like n=1 Tax=Rousettus aegyptiacus TaxID=9407 RepID=UPI00168D094B|nr:anaphase-promoting complex subunit 10-like [Rousettus aegyptiacus]
MATPNKTPPGADSKKLERTGTAQKIGSQALWSLSSCKPGFGVDQLQDENLETYCQSDVSQPYLVNIQFRKITVKILCIYADYKSDESYTPSKISVRVGNNFHNLQEIQQDITGPVSTLSSQRGPIKPLPWEPHSLSASTCHGFELCLNLNWWNQMAGFMFP